MSIRREKKAGGYPFPLTHVNTIGVEFQAKTLSIKVGPRRYRVKLQLWDTAGAELFMTLTRNYFRDVAGAVVVHDLTRPETAAGIRRWIQELERANPATADDLPLLVAANKCRHGLP